MQTLCPIRQEKGLKVSLNKICIYQYIEKCICIHSALLSKFAAF